MYLLRSKVFGMVRTYLLRVGIISPTAMVPAHRLVTLLQQAKDFQVHQCLFHLRFSDGPHSLLTDHACDSNAFPSATIKILSGHTDEVWDIKFSHDGTRLASSSKDSCVIIWDTEARPGCLLSLITDLGTSSRTARPCNRRRLSGLVPGG